jgi:hypothetical protein
VALPVSFSGRTGSLPAKMSAERVLSRQAWISVRRGIWVEGSEWYSEVSKSSIVNGDSLRGVLECQLLWIFSF